MHDALSLPGDRPTVKGQGDGLQQDGFSNTVFAQEIDFPFVRKPRQGQVAQGKIRLDADFFDGLRVEKTGFNIKLLGPKLLEGMRMVSKRLDLIYNIIFAALWDE